ncbi:putative bifunctional diguanylate cyclase/phosphodiesterase [Peteryoungia algae]|uniref:EAL domain-containing protein n=1 Tax=Peteryoungia algae TaxID=2919917 RepID=A0ABT0CZC2_9HYPH|nr:EAL domain-containing protein [Rhizobium sp. SSM4.3]MCJ8238532.1 EAL domain-containing protein [Rhizobium sp. SSM4.3]
MTGRGSEEQQTTRVIRAYQAATLAVALFSALWAVIFAINGLPAVAIAESYPVTIALVCFVLVSQGKFGLVNLVVQISFLAFTIGFCLMFDVPETGSPRVTHLFLPVLGMLGYLNHLRHPSRLQFAIIASSLVAFVVLHAADLRLPFAEPLPPELRIVGIWMNPTIATLVFCSTIYILQKRLSAPGGMARDLMRAMRRGELTLAYQPQVDRKGKVIGAEALLRWNHPTRGAIAPTTFIPAAEEVGLMPILGGFVLEEALTTLARWQKDPRTKGLTLSVNVSASQFNESDFCAVVRGLLTRHAVDPGHLQLELTESVLIAGLEPVARKMADLTALEIRFSLDDFGTGFSSLAYLRSLPVAELKIDRSFVASITESDRDAALVRSIRALARDLGLRTVAEGVEMPAQFAFLHDIGCDVFQGWLFGRAMPLDEFETSLSAPPRLPATVPLRPARTAKG